MIYGNYIRSIQNDNYHSYIESIDIMNETDILFSEFSIFLSEAESKFDMIPVKNDNSEENHDNRAKNKQNNNGSKKIIDKIKEFVKKIFEKLKEFIKKIIGYIKNFKSKYSGIMNKITDKLNMFSKNIDKYYNGNVFDYDSYFNQINDTFIDIEVFNDMSDLYTKISDSMFNLESGHYKQMWGPKLTKIEIDSDIIADKIFQTRKQIVEESENFGLDILKRSIKTKDSKLKQKISKIETFPDLKKVVDEYVNTPTTETFNVNKIGLVTEMIRKTDALKSKIDPKEYLFRFGKVGTVDDLIQDLGKDIQKMERKCEEMIYAYEEEPVIAKETTKLASAFSNIIKNYLEYCVWLNKMQQTMIDNAYKTIDDITSKGFNKVKNPGKHVK